MNVKTLTQIVSGARLHLYMKSQAGEPEKVVGLYSQNILLSRSFYPLLSILEIALRNALDRECTSHFGNHDWLQAQKTGFMRDSQLTNDFLKRSVDEAEKKLQKRGKTITHGGIIAELTFGFWTELFDRTPYRLLKGIAIKAFVNLPKTVKRVNIFNSLNQIRIFRNRVYHNEPICFHGENCATLEAQRIQKSILDILQWLSSDIPVWLDKLDDSPFELAMTDRYSANARSILDEIRAKLSHTAKILLR